jgi:hypothetical protein
MAFSPNGNYFDYSNAELPEGYGMRRNRPFRIWMTFFNYFLQDSFNTLEDAIQKGKSTGFDFQVYEDNRWAYTGRSL